MSQRIDGLHFEAEFIHKLFDAGFWVLQIPQTAVGQPIDVIAVRYDKAFLIDCKHCTGDRFVLDRIEPNQESALYLSETLAHNTNHFFAIYLDSKIWMLPFVTAMNLKNRNVKSLNKKDIASCCYSLEDWIHAFCNKRTVDCD